MDILAFGVFLNSFIIFSAICFIVIAIKTSCKWRYLKEICCIIIVFELMSFGVNCFVGSWWAIANLFCVVLWCINYHILSKSEV